MTHPQNICSPILNYLFHPQNEVKNDLNYYAIQIQVYHRRLEKDENFNFDIGLVKLDRYVMFTPDVSPICMDGFLKDFWPNSTSAYISGFGLTIYKKETNDKDPECSTNEFLPRPYHTCKVNIIFRGTWPMPLLKLHV